MHKKIHLKLIYISIVWLCGMFSLHAQEVQDSTKSNAEKTDEIYTTKDIEIKGKVYTAMVSDQDTFIMLQLEDVSITAPREFKDYDEYRKYNRYRRYAEKVYPYAVEAIKIFREQEYATRNFSKRKRRRHLRRLSKKLQKKFKEPLKNPTKTQGLILTKMIENELDTPMYDLVKGLRGGFTAFYYHQFGKLYGYNLKKGYKPGEDKILDIILKDYDISYEIPK